MTLLTYCTRCMLSKLPLEKRVTSMQHIIRREKRASANLGDGDKYISGFEGDPTDSDPGYEVK